MNEMRRIDSEADEIARVRAVIDQYPLPDFVVGYTVKLGEFDDEPAMWIRFQTTHRFPDSIAEGLAIGRELSRLGTDVHMYLQKHYPERYSYFRWDDIESATKRQA